MPSLVMITMSCFVVSLAVAICRLLSERAHAPRIKRFVFIAEGDLWGAEIDFLRAPRMAVDPPWLNSASNWVR